MAYKDTMIEFMRLDMVKPLQDRYAAESVERLWQEAKRMTAIKTPTQDEKLRGMCEFGASLIAGEMSSQQQTQNLVGDLPRP